MNIIMHSKSKMNKKICASQRVLGELRELPDQGTIYDPDEHFVKMLIWIGDGASVSCQTKGPSTIQMSILTKCSSGSELVSID